MMLHDIVVVGAGFGSGVLWLGFAFMLGDRLRHLQPTEPLDIGLTRVDSTMPESRRSGDRRRRTAEEIALR
jgi:hypothetical protein